jgi:serine/threonine-protein kinase
MRIYDLGESEGTRFITMEFIDGEDLGTILAREGKLAPQHAVEIIRQVCNGLKAAHAKAVIHRDLKPSNIMCDVSGRVVIMDFGLAKAERDEGLTRTEAMLGTPCDTLDPYYCRPTHASAAVRLTPAAQGEI